MTFEKSDSIHSLLKPLLIELGSKGGAFHHEFFILKDGRIASVEPNRRPAGMWIWDLANWAFEDFDPWTRWTDRCLTDETTSKILLRPKAFAGVRGLIAKKSGKIKFINRQKIEAGLEERFGSGNYRISFLKQPGSSVNSEPRDNADFLGYLALKNVCYEKLLIDLDDASRIFLSHLEVSSCELR